MSSQQQQNPESKPQKTLSCSSCRQRKIKCDKVQPICTQCSRFGLDCLFPSRKPNRRAPRLRQRELLDRISRLESIVGQADPQKLQQLDSGAPEADESSPGSAAGEIKQPPRSAGSTGSRSRGGSVGAGRGREGSTSSAKHTPTPGSKYLSSDFWGNLSAEVVGIRQVLDLPSDEDSEDEYQDSPESFDANTIQQTNSGFLLGNPHHHERTRVVHPPAPIRARLWQIYTTHVDPCLKILHCPTIAQEFQLISGSDSNYIPPPHTNALLFCIYFCAVTSLSGAQCQAYFGERFEILNVKYRILAERALAAADYLNTTELATLQAFAIFVVRYHLYNSDQTSANPPNRPCSVGFPTIGLVGHSRLFLYA